MMFIYCAKLRNGRTEDIRISAEDFYSAGEKYLKMKNDRSSKYYKMELITSFETRTSCGKDKNSSKGENATAESGKRKSLTIPSRRREKQ